MGRKGQTRWLMSRQPSCMATPGGRCTGSCHLKTLMAASGRLVGKHDGAMYRTRDAPRIWQDHLRETQLDMMLKESVHPSWGVSSWNSRHFSLRARGRLAVQRFT